MSESLGKQQSFNNAFAAKANVKYQTSGAKWHCARCGHSPVPRLKNRSCCRQAMLSRDSEGESLCQYDSPILKHNTGEAQAQGEGMLMPNRRSLKGTHPHTSKEAKYISIRNLWWLECDNPPWFQIECLSSRDGWAQGAFGKQIKYYLEKGLPFVQQTWKLTAQGC